MKAFNVGNRDLLKILPFLFREAFIYLLILFVSMTYVHCSSHLSKILALL